MRVLLLSLLLFGCDRGGGRTLYYGGPILTMDAGDRIVEAIAIDGDRIGAVGTLEEVRAWAGQGVRERDLAGGAQEALVTRHIVAPGLRMSDQLKIKMLL